jgi:hypothetical protein
LNWLDDNIDVIIFLDDNFVVITFLEDKCVLTFLAVIWLVDNVDVIFLQGEHILPNIIWLNENSLFHLAFDPYLPAG